MATHHGGAGCPLDRDINLHVEAMGNDNNNEITYDSDATATFEGPEAEGHANDPIYSNQNKLTALMREINDLHQRVEVGEGQPAESLDCIECELQNLLIALHPPPPPTSTEPFREVIHQYMNTLCTTQKANEPNQLITTGYSCF